MTEKQNRIDDDDVKYALKQAGIDLEVIHKERLAAEAEQRAKVEAERLAKIEAGRRARNESADKELIEGFGKFYFVTLNDKRLSKLKSVDDLKCPGCGTTSPVLAGMVREFVRDESTGSSVIAQRTMANRRVVFQVDDAVKCPICKETFHVWLEKLRRPEK